MIFFTDEELDRLISEDVPYYDLTTRMAKFGSQLARIQFYTKEPTVICCTEEVIRMYNKMNISPTLITLSGEYIEGGVKFFEAEGLAKHLHTMWRVSANLMEYASGIATRTRLMVEKAKKINPDVIITATRKTIPYTRKIAAKAVLIGGGNMNRLSLSESMLFFPNHYKFYGGINGFISRIDSIKKESGGRQIIVEAQTSDDVVLLSKTNVDIIQIEGILPSELQPLLEKIRAINPKIKLAAAGGITLENLQPYVETGVDIIITSFPNHCKPADFRVEIDPFSD